MNGPVRVPLAELNVLLALRKPKDWTADRDWVTARDGLVAVAAAIFGEAGPLASVASVGPKPRSRTELLCAAMLLVAEVQRQDEIEREGRLW